jgi:hypothetical protein
MVNNSGNSPILPADNPAIIAHITVLEGIIARLANNSASCKTWCLTLVAALLSLAGATHSPQMVTAALVPIIIFGFLDVMYLASEVAYRDLYAGVVKAIRDGTYRRERAYDTNARADKGCILEAIGSWSITPYYALIIFYLIALAAGWPALLASATK